MSDLYQEIILDHMKHPRNKGVLQGDNVVSTQKRLISCGDSLQIYLQLSKDKDPVVQKITWQGNGCAISIAAMSLLSEHVKGQKISQVLSFTKVELLELLGMEHISAARESCLMLSLQGIQALLKNRYKVNRE